MKTVKETKVKSKIIKLNVSSQVDVNFREYALYVLENRGIPDWHDSINNVQRIILNNAKPSYDKTLTLVGSCISDGYHHGDSSVGGAINKITRPFGCAEQLLLGDGFFGSPYKHEPAAPRYTSVKINPDISKIIKENGFLNTKDDEGKYNPLHVNLPVGLATFVIGIAVGYSSTILPRNLDDIKKFLEGKKKEVKPYFKNFKGTIKRYQNLDKTWLIEGAVEYDDFRQRISITDLPPIMKPANFIKKLEKIIDDHNGKCVLTNKSSENIDLTIRFTGFKNEWDHFKTMIAKATKILVTETPVFVKDGLVIQYDKIEDYLTDFKYRIGEIAFKRTEYFYNETCFDLEYNKAKKEYFEFMLKQKRKEEEVVEFLKKFSKQIAGKLNAIFLHYLNNEELARTIEKIKELELLKKERKKLMDDEKKIFSKLVDVSIARGIKNKAVKNLFDEMSDVDGIEFFNAEDDLEIQEEQDTEEHD